jgi:hypothetical protein
LSLDDHEFESNFSTINAASNKTNGSKGTEFNQLIIYRIFFSENPLDRAMVHALTWLPVKMFTTSVMEAAVDCWSWAIVGRPELELLVNKYIYS